MRGGLRWYGIVHRWGGKADAVLLATEDAIAAYYAAHPEVRS